METDNTLEILRFIQLTAKQATLGRVRQGDDFETAKQKTVDAWDQICQCFQEQSGNSSEVYSSDNLVMTAVYNGCDLAELECE